jgi:hypothetical protein
MTLEFSTHLLCSHLIGRALHNGFPKIAKDIPPPYDDNYEP